MVKNPSKASFPSVGRSLYRQPQLRFLHGPAELTGAFAHANVLFRGSIDGLGTRWKDTHRKRGTLDFKLSNAILGC